VDPSRENARAPLRGDGTEPEAGASPMNTAGRRRPEWFANLCHDIHGPLNVITGFSELMFEGKVGPVSEEHREYLGDILDSSRHLAQLIDEVLAFAGAQVGKADAGPEPAPLVDIMAEIRDALQGLAVSKRTRVTVHVLRQSSDCFCLEVEDERTP
jgi:signal transduction histidine kinase